MTTCYHSGSRPGRPSVATGEQEEDGFGLGNNRSTFFIQIIFTRCLLYSSCSCCVVVLVRPPPPPSSINYTLRWVGMCAEEKKRCTSCRCERVSPTTDTEEFDTRWVFFFRVATVIKNIFVVGWSYIKWKHSRRQQRNFITQCWPLFWRLNHG